MNNTMLNNNRAHEIDGLRGWAALSVMVFHVFAEMFKHVIPELDSAWLLPFINGGFDVCVFFILSGDALSVAFFSSQFNPASIDKILVRRYTRLVVPIVYACLLVYLVRLLGWDYHKQAASVLKIEDWLGDFINFDFSVFGFVKYTLIEVFSNHSRTNAYNPFLWTMAPEMIGSMLVFLSCYLWVRLSKPLLLVSVLGAYLILNGSFLGCFFAGVALGYLRHIGYFSKFQQHPNALIKAVPLLTVCVVYLLMRILAHHHIPRHLDMILAVMFVWAVYANSILLGFFANAFSRWLGKVSFALYLVHFAVIISLESWLVLMLNDRRMLTSMNAFYVALLATVVSLLLASAFARLEVSSLKLVDKKILRLL